MPKIFSVIEKIKTLIKHQGIKKYSFNAGWLMIDKLLRIFLGLFVGVWVAKYLGPADFGILSFALSIVALFGIIGNFGLDQIVIRNIVNRPEDRDSILGTSFFLRISGSTFILLLLFIILQFTAITAHEKLIIMTVALGQLFLSFNVVDLYFRSQVKAKFSGLTNSFGAIFSAVLRIAFILLGFSVLWFAVAVVLEQVVLAILFVYFYLRNHLNIFKWRFSFITLKNLMKDGWPLLFSGMAVSIFMNIDQVMIKEMMNNKAVGEYAVAVKLSQAWYFVPLAISQSFYPALIKSKKESDSLYYLRIQNLLNFMAWLSISIGIIMTFASGFIINILYGRAYSESAMVLSINIWTGVFISMGTIRGLWINIENLQKYSLYTTLGGVAANVALNLLLIPLYGIMGAAIASVISYCLTIFSLGFYKRGRELAYRMLLPFNPVFIGKTILSFLYKQ